jgi:histidyl-tRNA synthetase
VAAQHDALAALGLPEFTILLNSRRVLAGLLQAFRIPAELGPGVLTSLDKLDRLAPADVVAELTERGLAGADAGELVGAMTAPDAADRIRAVLKVSDEGMAGMEEVGQVRALVAPQVPAGRIVFTPRLVRGLSYYTGPIWEVVAPGVPGSIGSGGRYDHLIEALGGPDVPATGSSLGVERILSQLPPSGAGARGRLDVAVTVLAPDLAAQSFGLAAAARAAGLRASVYLGSSGKLTRQLRWASDQGARWCLLYGYREQESGLVTVRDLDRRDEAGVPLPEVGAYLSAATR